MVYWMLRAGLVVVVLDLVVLAVEWVLEEVEHEEIDFRHGGPHRVLFHDRHQPLC